MLLKTWSFNCKSSYKHLCKNRVQNEDRVHIGTSNTRNKLLGGAEKIDVMTKRIKCPKSGNNRKLVHCSNVNNNFNKHQELFTFVPDIVLQLIIHRLV